MNQFIGFLIVYGLVLAVGIIIGISFVR